MDIKILDGLYINQNVIILIISYIGIVYVADNNNLQCVGCICWLIFIVAALSTICSLIAYTYHYVIKKCRKTRR